MTGPGIPRSPYWRPLRGAIGLCGALIWASAAPAQAQVQDQVLVLAQGEQIVGRPRVIDGDTLDFAGTSLDLYGIDAPEAEQICGAAGQTWNCGLEARWALLNRVGRHWVTCVPRDRPPGTPPRAVCYLAGIGQHDVAAWLVGAGWALADPAAGDAYQADEAAARGAGKGLWRGAFEAPWDWRRRRAGQKP